MREKGRIGKDKFGKYQKLFGQKTATKHCKTGLIAGYTKLPNTEKYVYIAPWIFNCNCDTIVFNTWLEMVFIKEAKLLQKAYPNNPITLIMDNVAYHKSKETENILAKNGINLKFQPSYSSDLNPIEHSWTHTKDDIRNTDNPIKSFEKKLCNSLNNRSYCY